MPAQPSTHVLVVGDSLVWQAEPAMRWIAAADGLIALDVWAVGGSALCDQLERLRGPDGAHYGVVVVAYSGNALTPCMATRTGSATETAIGYADDLGVLDRLARWRGQRLIVVGDPDEHPVGRIIPVVRAHLFTQADRLGVSKLDLSRSLASLPRAPDGLHLCAPGPTERKCPSATTYAATLLDGLYKLLRLR